MTKKKDKMYGATSIFNTGNYEENYGRHLLTRYFKGKKFNSILDIGCGNGDDLQVMKKISKNVKTFGVDFHNTNNETLKKNNINVINIDIEKQKLPIKSNSIDLVIANQVFEHVKELFWINHEIFRVLKRNGYLFIGVPNGLSLHNRLLGVFGIHPRSSKIISAHVRIFSKRDTIMFYKSILGKKVEVVKFYGSQFYPFNKFFSRIFSFFTPSLSTSIFFVLKKNNTYKDEFLKWLDKAELETNFYKGK